MDRSLTEPMLQQAIADEIVRERRRAWDLERELAFRRAYDTARADDFWPRPRWWFRVMFELGLPMDFRRCVAERKRDEWARDHPLEVWLREEHGT